MAFFRNGVLICAVAVLVLQGPRFIPESSPAARGASSANSHGCIDCHGRPEPDYPDDAYLSCADAGINTAHTRYEGLCSDVLAYFEVVRLKRTFPVRAQIPNQNRLLQGEILARLYNCFQCHGELGQGGFRNAGALKGYIPGYFGKDFALLTQNSSGDSVQSWIRQGIDPHLLSRPIEGKIAKFFIDRQEVSMPVFGALPDSTIQVLAEYVIMLNEFGAMDAKAIREYGRRTQQHYVSNRY